MTKQCFRRWFLDPVLKELQEREERIMSKISEFETRQKERHTAMEVAVEGIATDIAELVAKIAELQNSPGEVTPEDQVLLDALEAASVALLARVQGINEAQ